jgi:hypothetical protein
MVTFQNAHLNHAVAFDLERKFLSRSNLIAHGKKALEVSSARRLRP